VFYAELYLDMPASSIILPKELSHYSVETVGLVIEAIKLYGYNTAIGKFVLAGFNDSIEIAYVFSKDKDLLETVMQLFEERKKGSLLLQNV